MTIHQLFKTYPKIETELLIAHVLKKDKEFLYTHLDTQLSGSQLSALGKLIKRREKGEPIAYIVGYKYFYGLKFKVNKNVLIPRPETEWLVETASRLVKSRTLKVENILDLATGSGCIAISIAKSIKNKKVRIYASDISKNALAVAKQNAKQHKVKISFRHSNLFSKFNQTFDIIIANLPYVPISDYKKLYKNLKFEPKFALSDNTNTWKLYETFFKQTPAHIKPTSIILLEIDPASKKHLTAYIKKYLPGKQFTFYKDIGGLLRYCVIS